MGERDEAGRRARSAVLLWGELLYCTLFWLFFIRILGVVLDGWTVYRSWALHGVPYGDLV